MNVCRVQCFQSFPLLVKWCGRIIETTCALVCISTIYQSCFRAFSSVFLIWTADMTTSIITEDSRFSVAQSVADYHVGSVQNFTILLFCLCNDLRWNRDQVDNPESIWTPCWNFELICCLCTEKMPLTYAHTHTHTHTHTDFNLWASYHHGKRSVTMGIKTRRRNDRKNVCKLGDTHRWRRHSAPISK